MICQNLSGNKQDSKSKVIGNGGISGGHQSVLLKGIKVHS